MSDERNANDETVPGSQGEYQSPAIEEVVTRETLEREVAYAGVVGPSLGIN